VSIAGWAQKSLWRFDAAAVILDDMSFRKPFRAQPVKLGAYERERQARNRRVASRRLLFKSAALAGGVFVVGMIATNLDQLATFYPACSWARVAGAAPIYRGQPGYREKLDADGDGVACEWSPR